jgi:hypothetical protein
MAAKYIFDAIGLGTPFIFAVATYSFFGGSITTRPLRRRAQFLDG